MTKFPLFLSPAGASALPRRAFLRYSGAATAGAALLLAGCKDDDDDTTTTTTTTTNGEAISLGSGDVAVLNLLQAGKQLSTELLDRIAATLSGADQQVVRAIQGQQRIHRDALKAAANANRTAVADSALSLVDLTVDFSAVDFTQRAAMLTAAHTLLTTLVAGAAGALRYTTRAATLTLLGQILSVDARHVVALTNLLPDLATLDPQDGLTDARNRALRPALTAAALNASLAAGSRLLTGNLA